MWCGCWGFAGLQARWAGLAFALANWAVQGRSVVGWAYRVGASSQPRRRRTYAHGLNESDRTEREQQDEHKKRTSITVSVVRYAFVAIAQITWTPILQQYLSFEGKLSDKQE